MANPLFWTGAKIAKYVEGLFSGLAKVATSGRYNDLADKPTIPAEAYGGTQIKKDDEGNYYYEVETEE